MLLDPFASSWVDPADPAELTDADFARAEVHVGGVLVRRGRGRPKAEETREQIALRVDRRLLARYRDAGPGWQTRMHGALEMAVELRERIAGVQASVAALRSRRCEAPGDDRSRRRTLTDEQLTRIEHDIDQMRRAVDLVVPD